MSTQPISAVSAAPETGTELGTKPARVLLVDDHAFFLRALRTLIEQEPDLAVCGTATDSKGLAEMVQSLSPSVVVMDVHLRSEDGVALATTLRTRFPQLPIVFLTSCQAGEVRARARTLSAGVIEKTQAPAEILRGLRTAIQTDTLRKQSKLVT